MDNFTFGHPDSPLFRLDCEVVITKLGVHAPQRFQVLNSNDLSFLFGHLRLWPKAVYGGLNAGDRAERSIEG